jgi:hypothetical protein
MSTSAAGHLSPAFPERAAWGTASKLRAWQEEALASYLRSESRDFLAVATPGAGKTTYALRVATELLATAASSGRSPSSPRPSTSRPSGRMPRRAWASTSTRVLQLQSGCTSHEYHGVALTYAQVAANAGVARAAARSTPRPS